MISKMYLRKFQFFIWKDLSTPPRERGFWWRWGCQLRPFEISWKSHVFGHFVTDTGRKWTKVWFPFDKNTDFLTGGPFDYSTFTGSQVSQRFTVTGVRWHFWNALGFSEFTFGGFLFCSQTFSHVGVCSNLSIYNYGDPGPKGLIVPKYSKNQ